jgi:hypothetical protein
MSGSVAGDDLAGKYEAVAYAAEPNPWSHPDHLAAVATLYGVDAPAVASCRVLEVGCSDGANLIPMALSLPGLDAAARGARIDQYLQAFARLALIIAA